MHRLAIALALAACAPAAVPPPAPPRDNVIAPPPAELVARLGLAPFYEKHLDVGGLPILSSAQVSDAALHEAAFLIRKMIGHRPELLRAIAAAGVRFVVMAPTELTTDVPEHSDLTPKGYWDRRARGLGATTARPATSCGEENLLRLDGDPYSTENILIHEFSHTVHELGAAAVDPTFQARLEAAFEHARTAGLWAGTYAMTNVAEYWAEAAQSWFDTNRTHDHDHGAIATRAQVLDYDPDVAALLTEVYGADAWRYEPPDTRIAAADRTRRFVWPEEVASELAALELLATSPGASRLTEATSSILFVNTGDRQVEILWIDFDGNLVPYATVRSGAMHAQSTFVGHAWLIRDDAGATLGYVVAGDTPGRVSIE